MLNHDLRSWLLLVALAMSSSVMLGCPHMRQTSYLKRLKTDKGMAAQYRSRCKAGCRAHLTMCSTDCMEQPPGEDCHSNCNDELINCKCPEDDKQCQKTCKEKYFECFDSCPQHNFCTGCASAYISCSKECEKTPECFFDSDCGRDFVCSEHKCIYAPACVTSASCPQNDNYLCYEGHCLPY
jgi:hypothetical protein